MAFATAILAVTLAAGCGGGDKAATTQEAHASAAGCEYVQQPPPRRSGGQHRSQARLAPRRTYVLIVRTSCGAFTVRVDQRSSPHAAASVVALARRGFYDGTTFHRIVPGYVIQAGDPTATGYGGAGYVTVDAPPPDTRYTFGTVAMSKNASTPTGTASSQFFIVTTDDAELSPENAVLGRVVAGKRVIRRIGRLGTPTGQPVQTVAIRSIRVVERKAKPTPSSTTTPGGTTTTSTPSTPGAGCRDVSRPAAKPEGRRTAPSSEVDASKTYAAVVQTTCGRFVVRLAVAKSPKTTASFVSLARAGFYDDTYFHRVVPNWIFQGGDPTGTGNGGPGYETVEPPPRNAKYTKGVVAMAKAAAAEAGTAGSQFFVVSARDSGLPADYAILGRVTSGMDVVDRIGALGDARTQQPTRYIVIERIRIRER